MAISDEQLLRSLFTLLAVLLGARLLLGLVLAVVAPSVRLGHPTLLGWSNAGWTSRKGLRITTKRVSFAFAPRQIARKAVFLLRIDGLIIQVPQTMLRSERKHGSTAPGPASSPEREKQTADDVAKAAKPTVARRTGNSVFKTFVADAWDRFVRLLSLTAPLVSLFAIEIEAQVVVEDVAQIEGLIDVGVGSRDLRLGLCAGIEGLKITPAVSDQTAAGQSAAVQVDGRSTIAVRVRLARSVMSALRNRDLASLKLPESSIDVDVTLPNDHTGTLVRIYRVKDLVQKLADSKRRDHDDKLENLPTNDFDDEQHVGAELPAALELLHAFNFKIPALFLSARFDHSVDVQDEKFAHVDFLAALSDLDCSVTMGGNSDDRGTNPSHRPFLGKDRKLGLGGRLSWKTIEIMLRQTNEASEQMLSSDHTVLTFAESTVCATSTWLPPSLPSIAWSEYPCDHSSSPRNANDTTVIFDGSFGRISGTAKFEILDHALKAFASRPSRARSKHCNAAGSRAEKVKRIRGVPRLVAQFKTAAIDLAIRAPQDKGEPSTGKAKTTFRSWHSPDVLRILLPEASINLSGEWYERSLRMSEAERRRAERVRREKSEADRHSGATVSRRDEPVVRPGAPEVPPPPPVHQDYYKRLPNKRAPASQSQLDQHDTEYHAHVGLHATTLNVFLLAAKDPSAQNSDAILSDEKAVRLDILAVGPSSVSTTQIIAGSSDDGERAAVLDPKTSAGDVKMLIERVEVDLWQPIVMSALRDFLQSMADASRLAPIAVEDGAAARADPKPLVDKMLADMGFYVAVGSFYARVAGSDPKNNVLAARGIECGARQTIFEFFLPTVTESNVEYTNRQKLQLRDDIRVEAISQKAANSAKKMALVKLTSVEFAVDPVTSVSFNTPEDPLRGRATQQQRSASKDMQWEYQGRAELHARLTGRRNSIMPRGVDPNREKHGMLRLPALSLRVWLSTAAPDSGYLDEVKPLLETESITLRLELFTIYLAFVAYSAVKAVLPRSDGSASKRTRSRRPPPLVVAECNVHNVHLFVTLPNEVPLYVNLHRPKLQYSPDKGVDSEWDSMLIASDCPTAPDMWDDLIRMREASVHVGFEPNAGFLDFSISVSAEAARIRIPFKYVVNRIFDNVSSLVKCVKQLSHQLIRGEQDYVQHPVPEDAKKLPEIKLDFKILTIEAQDDPFETKLNMIWRAGTAEQLHRLERQAAFQSKIAKVRSEAQRVWASAEGLDMRSPLSAAPTVLPFHDSRRSSLPGDQHNAPKTELEIRLDEMEAEAQADLYAYDSTSWIRRSRNAGAEQSRREDATARKLYGPHVSRRFREQVLVDLVPSFRTVPLARAEIHGAHFAITKPSFPMDELPDYIADVGKGMPRDMTYSLLVAVHLSWTADEVRMQLRDYPLPILHILAMPDREKAEEKTFEIDTDLVIAEEMAGPESIRHISCAVVPAGENADQEPGYSVMVQRTGLPTKTYAQPELRVRSPYPIRFGWGVSMQPAIQDLARVIDTFSKPSADPSDRPGFWDKLRLQIHWRLKCFFLGDGPVHFHLKGSRDPYDLVGYGAGFSKSWRGNVRFTLGYDNPDHEFFQVFAQEYILGVPNLRDYIDNAATGIARESSEDDHSSTAHSNHGSMGDPSFSTRWTRETEFIKICAKFVGGVRWGMGAKFERPCPANCPKEGCKGKSAFFRECRFFDFLPHWKVKTIVPQDGQELPEDHDSFEGFRAPFIHFSISVTSPMKMPLPSTTDDDESMHSFESNDGYNSLHFTPACFNHFSRWWSLFDSNMSLPVRQGKLFPQTPVGSKKFGKACMTIKYRVALAPLYVTHTYRQDSTLDWQHGRTTFLGLKLFIKSFNADMHQRAQSKTLARHGDAEPKTIIHKVFNKVEVVLNNIDLRTLAADFDEPEKLDVELGSDQVEEEEGIPTRPTMTQADCELRSYDADDYVDTTYSIPGREPTYFHVAPLATCPVFSYYRDADAERHSHPSLVSTIDRDRPDNTPSDGKKTKFGKEPSHTCLMGHAPDGAATQLAQVEARLSQLTQELARHRGSKNEQRLKDLNSRIESTKRIISQFKAEERAKDQAQAPEMQREFSAATSDSGSIFNRPTDEDAAADVELPHLTSGLYQDWDDWTNRYIFHNPSIQINNASRELLLKYWYESRARRDFMYHLSAAAGTMIREVAEQHQIKINRMRALQKKIRAEQDATKERRRRSTMQSKGSSKDDTDSIETDNLKGRADNLHMLFNDLDRPQDLQEGHERQPGHLCMFIKPQFSLSSDIDDKSTLIVTAFHAQVKSFSVEDTTVRNDPTFAHVQRETYALLEGLQVFYPADSTRKKHHDHGLFVPLETLVDLQIDPVGFDRVVPRTSALLRYIKVNQLRSNSHSSVSKHSPASDAQGGETVGKNTPRPSYDTSRPSHDGNASDSRPSMTRSNTLESDGASTPSSSTHGSYGPTNGQNNRPVSTIDSTVANEPSDSLFVLGDRFSVSANPDHFAAIYNVIADLLLQSDSTQKRRTERIQSLVFKFDFQRLVSEVDRIVHLQQQLNSMGNLFHEYQMHLDELVYEDRVDLFAARAQYLRMAEELNLTIEAISKAHQFYDVDKSKAVDIQKQKSKESTGLLFAAKASELDWRMFDSHNQPFAKFGVKGAHFRWLSHRDGTVANDLRIDDLQALNTSANHLWAEIIIKEKSDARNGDKALRPFATIAWDTQPSVGGIAIFDRFVVEMHPMKLQLEHKVGVRIREYLFSRRKKMQSGSDESPTKKKTLRAAASSPSLRDARSSAHQSFESLPNGGNTPSGSRSGTSTPSQLTSASASTKSRVASMPGSPDSHSLRHAKSTEILTLSANEDSLDAKEMRTRASMNRTFMCLQVASTNLVLTYHSDSDDRAKFPDVYNIRYQTPSMEYREVVWSFGDMVDQLRKDVIRSIWSQKGQIVSQLLSKAHRKMPRALAEYRSQASKGFKDRLNRFSLPGQQVKRSASDSFNPSSTSSASTSSPLAKQEFGLDTHDFADSDSTASDSDDDEFGRHVSIQAYVEERLHHHGRSDTLTGASQLTAEPDEMSLSGSSNGTRNSPNATFDTRTSTTTSSSSSSMNPNAADRTSVSSMPALPTVRIHSPQSSESSLHLKLDDTPKPRKPTA